MNRSRTILLILTLLALLLAGSCAEEPEGTFTLTLRVDNPPPGRIILSRLDDVNRKKTTVLGGLPLDAEGRFTRSFDLEPHVYELDLFGRETVTLAVDRGQDVEVTADGRDLKIVKVKGSPDTEKLQAYEKYRKESLERLVRSVRDEIKKLEEEEGGAETRKEIERLGVLEIKNYEKHREELNDFIRTRMGTSIAVYPTTLRWGGDANIPFYESLARSFAASHPGLEVTRRVREKVDVLKNTRIGGKAPDMRLPDTNGKEAALTKVKSKYVLVDFWASWCGPCRRESAIIAGLHEKYRDKGFDIYGVSLDTERDKWLEALEKDGRTWTNVSTLQGFETPATFDYAVTALPAKFLLDEQGRIVAKDLHGEDLAKKLEELLGG